MSLGSYDIFYTRPICAGLLLVAFAMILRPLIEWIRQRSRTEKSGAETPLPRRGRRCRRFLKCEKKLIKRRLRP
jgi:hypothetical protein